MGALLTVLVLEACRRTTGPVLPLICVAFFLYAYYGGFLPVSWPISHAGVDFSQIINGFYNDHSGFYGIPLDVCATYIVLFTIYGAVLDATGVDTGVPSRRKVVSDTYRWAATTSRSLGVCIRPPYARIARRR